MSPTAAASRSTLDSRESLADVREVTVSTRLPLREDDPSPENMERNLSTLRTRSGVDGLGSKRTALPSMGQNRPVPSRSADSSEPAALIAGHW
ncbi:hypothetical protein HYQ46_009507 [Verticillium longisporum]|nr:hypothetical protein HYQ46_009507 [Verticillium longisporum]